jgi:hypothetical protein
MFLFQTHVTHTHVCTHHTHTHTHTHTRTHTAAICPHRAPHPLRPASLRLHDDTHALPQLGDLGVSRLLGRAEDLMETRVGTPMYLAPELIRQVRRRRCVRVSVFVWVFVCVCWGAGLCVSLYVCLCLCVERGC